MQRIMAILLLPALLSLAPGIALAGEEFEFGTIDMPAPPMPPMLPHEAMMFSSSLGGDGLTNDPMQMVMLAQRLELTPEQRQAYGKLMDEAGPKLRDLMFRMQDSRKALDAAMDGEGKDDATLRQLADAQGKLHGDLMYLQMTTRQKLHALLNDEQRKQLEEGGSGWHGPFARMRTMRGGPGRH